MTDIKQFSRGGLWGVGGGGGGEGIREREREREKKGKRIIFVELIIKRGDLYKEITKKPAFTA